MDNPDEKILEETTPVKETAEEEITAEETTPVKICKNCNYHHVIETNDKGVEIDTPRCPGCYARYDKVMTHKAPVPKPKNADGGKSTRCGKRWKGSPPPNSPSKKQPSKRHLLRKRTQQKKYPQSHLEMTPERQSQK